MTAIIVDEAHCIHDLGEDFREIYRKLKMLCNFTGFEVPIVACSGTIPTDTFTVIWDSLEFGRRPFWGVDVGINRPNLFYSVRTYEKLSEALYKVLNILPKDLTADMSPLDIPKTLVYLPSPEQCMKLVRDIRLCLPQSLRSKVYHFSAGLSDNGKKKLWDLYNNDSIRILVSTEATALGCNDRKIVYCFVFLAGLDPRSLSVLLQRWGRVWRSDTGEGFGFFFVQRWAVRPQGSHIPSVQRLIGRPRLQETKAATTRRSKLPVPLENFINVHHLEMSIKVCHIILYHIQYI